MATSAEKCSLTSAAAAANDVMISWSRVRTTSCSSRRAPRTSSTCASSSLWRSSSVESSSRASGLTGPSADELALELLGVLGQRRALGRLGLGQADQVLGRRAEVAQRRARAGPRCAGRPRWPRGRGCGCGCAPHRGAARSCGGPGAAARASRRRPAPRRPGPGSRGAATRRCRRAARARCWTSTSRRASAAPSASSRAPARGRRGPLLGVALQAPLHLGLALAEDPPALGDAGHPHLELLAPPRAPRPAAPRAPARRSSASSSSGSDAVQLRLLGRDLGQPLLRLRHGGAGLVELAGQAALLLGGPLRVGPPGLAGRRVPVGGPLGARRGRRGRGPARSAPR